MAKSVTKTNPVAVPDGSYLEWGPVMGGTVIATAISIVLFQFGAGVGLSTDATYLESGDASWSVLPGGLWTALVALISATTGGYVAGRMRSRFADARESEVEFRDGVHGLTVWAASTIVAAIVIGLIGVLSAIGISVETEAAQLSADQQRWASNMGIIGAFATATGSALGAAGAWFAATTGGTHRDEGVNFDIVVPSMFRR